MDNFFNEVQTECRKMGNETSCCGVKVFSDMTRKRNAMHAHDEKNMQHQAHAASAKHKYLHLYLHYLLCVVILAVLSPPISTATLPLSEQ